MSEIPATPNTRKEAYLAAAAGQAVEYPAKPITREEAYLKAIAEKPSGGGGTTDYEQLEHKPQIGGVELSGNKTAAQLGLATETALGNKVDKVDGKGLSTNDYTDDDKAIVGGVTGALAGKQDALTVGSHIDIDSNTISVQRWAVPAGKVVYTVITSSENYGQNVHVQRHTEGGAFIDDRTYTVQTFGSATVDDVISIVDQYAKFNISLLKDSDEQQAGYSYIVQPINTPTSNSFTFMMAQEENANDLIIRSELNAAVGYSTTEVNTGVKWVDGKDVYKKVIDMSASPVSLTHDAWVSTGVSASGIGQIIKSTVIGEASGGNEQVIIDHCEVGIIGGEIKVCLATSVGSRAMDFVIIEYTKSTT